MYSLIKYDNDEYDVVQSNMVKITENGNCIVKYKGTKYKAILIVKNDNKASLVKYKNIEQPYSQLLTKISPTSKSMQLVPLVNKYEIDEYLHTVPPGGSDASYLSERRKNVAGISYRCKNDISNSILKKKNAPVSKSMQLKPLVNKYEIDEYSHTVSQKGSGASYFSQKRKNKDEIGSNYTHSISNSILKPKKKTQVQNNQKGAASLSQSTFSLNNSASISFSSKKTHNPVRRNKITSNLTRILSHSETKPERAICCQKNSSSLKSNCKQNKTQLITKITPDAVSSQLKPTTSQSISPVADSNSLLSLNKITNNVLPPVFKSNCNQKKRTPLSTKITPDAVSSQLTPTTSQSIPPVADFNSFLSLNKTTNNVPPPVLKSNCNQKKRLPLSTKITPDAVSPELLPVMSQSISPVADSNSILTLNKKTNFPPPTASHSNFKHNKSTPVSGENNNSAVAKIKNTSCLTPVMSQYILPVTDANIFSFSKLGCQQNKSTPVNNNTTPDNVFPDLSPLLPEPASSNTSPAKESLLNRLSNINNDSSISASVVITPNVFKPKFRKKLIQENIASVNNSSSGSSSNNDSLNSSLGSTLLNKNDLPLNDSGLISSSFSTHEKSYLNLLPSGSAKCYKEPLSKSISPSVNKSTCENNKNCSTSTSYLEKNTFNSAKSTNLSKSSNNTFSDYFPNSTIDMTDENINSTYNTLEEQEKSVEEIENPLKLSRVKVPHRSQVSKKHFCIFCKTLQTKLSRHLYFKHKSERQIKEALKFPPNSKDRLNIIEELRKKGDFLHNTCEEHNSGILIVSRQQQVTFQKTADDYVCCKYCKGFFSKNTLRIHLGKCGNKNKNVRDNLISSRRITQYMHAAANFTLRTKIFPVLRNDEVTKAIRYDELVIKYGNKLSEKYTLAHQHDMIRSHLRLLGRFVIEVKKLNSCVQQLKDIYKPGLFDACVNALRTVANWDDSLMWFKTPAVAQHLTSLIKKCGSKQRTEFIKTQSEELKKDLEDFLLLWEEEIPVLINKKAFDDQCNQKRIKKVILPSKDDIRKLYLFLKNKMLESIDMLQKHFNINHWYELVKSTLIFIQIFNRRRAGEIERLTIDNYLNKEVITENVERDLLEKMSKESVSFAKQFVRLTLRGKLGRTVSVLLSPLCTKAIDLILKYRTKAGIAENNEYIFSRKGTSKFSKLYYRACPLLKQFSLECGAEIPQSLRGTSLRKHIATYTSLLNIEEASVDQLANFMGHHKDIHKSIYRVSVPVAEITCVSKLLMSAIGEDEEEGDVEEDEIESLDGLEDSNPHQNSSLSSNRKRRSTSPYGKTKRRKWSQEEKDAICSNFGDLKELERLPSVMQCLEAIKSNAVLKNRTPVQIKTWIDNQRRYK